MDKMDTRACSVNSLTSQRDPKLFLNYSLSALTAINFDYFCNQFFGPYWPNNRMQDLASTLASFLRLWRLRPPLQHFHLPMLPPNHLRPSLPPSLPTCFLSSSAPTSPPAARPASLLRQTSNHLPTTPLPSCPHTKAVAAVVASPSSACFVSSPCRLTV